MLIEKEYLIRKRQVGSQRIRYVICATPRTGSTFLCEALEYLEIIQHPECLYEALYPKNKETDLFKHTPPEQYMKAWLDRADQNGVSGCKILASQLREHVSTVPKMMLQNMIDLFPDDTYFIWLKRKNKLRQAVSMTRASKTNMWRKMRRHENRPTPKFVITDTEIDKQAYALRKDDLYLKKFFRESKVKPLILYYEDFQDDISQAVQEILNYIGLDKKKNIPVRKGELLRQSDAITERLVSAYAGILTKPYLVQEIYFYWVSILDVLYKVSMIFRRRSVWYGRILDYIKNFISAVF